MLKENNWKNRLWGKGGQVFLASFELGSKRGAENRQKSGNKQGDDLCDHRKIDEKRADDFGWKKAKDFFQTEDP